MREWGSYNASDQTLAGSMSDDIQRLTKSTGEVTYRAIGRHHYIVSWHAEGRVFYNRTALVDGMFSTVEITYREADSPVWNANTSRVSGRFKPARRAR